MTNRVFYFWGHIVKTLKPSVLANIPTAGICMVWHALTRGLAETAQLWVPSIGRDIRLSVHLLLPSQVISTQILINIPWRLSTFLTGIYNENLHRCIAGAFVTSQFTWFKAAFAIPFFFYLKDIFVSHRNLDPQFFLVCDFGWQMVIFVFKMKENKAV